jgi:hypothetical protein
MIIAKDTLFGIEKRINLIQMYLDGKITLFDNIKLYGRVYDNLREDKITPEIVNENNEYFNPFADDNIDLSFGVLVKNRTIGEGFVHNAKIDLVFTINNTSNYDYEYILMYFNKLLKQCNYIDDIDTINEGVKNVFKGYNTDGFKTWDILPRMCFSFGCSTVYNEQIC